MKALYNWLKEFVDVTASPAELRARLSLAGVAIDSMEESPAGPVLDAEITANRPDCLGHYGLAREVAAIYLLPVKPVEPKLTEAGEKVGDATRVEIECADLCRRYTARIVRGVKVQPSPDWLRQRLEAIGEKSINNVVDVTNYVMFELGQPLHAFDFDQLAERRIVVRRARPGERMRTLDGAERALAKDMCVVADGSRAVAIAGVMGAANSEISFSSRNILIESAWFDPVSIRPEMAELASRRAAALIQQVAGGETLAGVVDLYPRREAPVTTDFRRKELLRVMGADVSDKEIEGILSSLGFRPIRTDTATGRVTDSPDASWRCEQPSWRRDVTREIDLVEEVARHYGYDKFPPRLPAAKEPAHRLPGAAALDRVRERIVGLGYREIVEIPLVDARRDALFRPASVTAAIIGNPLAEDASVMRSSGLVSMLSALEWNLNRHQRNLRLFEIGKRYELRDGEPVETAVLTLGATGLARDKSIHEAAREFGFADLKGDLDRLGELAGGFAWYPGGPGWFAGGRSADIGVGGGAPDASRRAWGSAGQLARTLADQLKLRQDIFLAELRLDSFLKAIEAARSTLRFVPIPRFPAVERDFSLVLADGIRFAQVAEVIGALGIQELQRVEAADLFRGGQVPPGKFSLMIRVIFQSPQATLTDAQTAEFSSRIVGALEQQLGAALRTS
jgi:phenylalanyl-tRNA synthetase beta chain